ncbi:MAG: glycosyltransferase family 2 protein [Rickettsiales bacterium]|nr:glycosyltransferase family 2 protein [Rickettsiales bacterium]
MAHHRSRPTLSVIIPCYNSAQYVADCLDSVMGQKHLSSEIICINDYSGDNTLKKLQEIQQKHKKSSNIQIINNDKNVGNLGVSSCRNMGIAQASGRYLMFVDSDDVIGYKNDAIINYDPYYCEAFRYVLDSFPNTGMVVGQLYKTTAPEIPTVSNEQFESISKRNNSNPQKQALKIVKYLNERVSSCATLYRTDFVKENRLYFDKDMLYFEDAKYVTDYAMRAYGAFKHIARPVFEAVNYNGGGYLYRIHNDSAMSKVQMNHSEQVFRRPERIENWIAYMRELLSNAGNAVGYDSELFHFLAKVKFSKEIPGAIEHYAKLCARKNRPQCQNIKSMQAKIPENCQSCNVNYFARNKASKNTLGINNCAQCPNFDNLIKYINAGTMAR